MCRGGGRLGIAHVIFAGIPGCSLGLRDDEPLELMSLDLRPWEFPAPVRRKCAEHVLRIHPLPFITPPSPANIFSAIQRHHILGASFLFALSLFRMCGRGVGS